MQERQKLILKGCHQCHGDLVLDEDVPVTETVVAYECLQCGRTMRFALPPTGHEDLAA